MCAKAGRRAGASHSVGNIGMGSWGTGAVHSAARRTGAVPGGCVWRRGAWRVAPCRAAARAVHAGRGRGAPCATDLPPSRLPPCPAAGLRRSHCARPLAGQPPAPHTRPGAMLA